jgi:hypothetical protein
MNLRKKSNAGFMVYKEQSETLTSADGHFVREAMQGYEK